MGNKRKSYYAVARGHKTGIFHFWEEVQPLVKGFPNALHKGFHYHEDAEVWLRRMRRKIEGPEGGASGELPDRVSSEWLERRNEQLNTFYAEYEKMS